MDREEMYEEELVKITYQIVPKQAPLPDLSIFSTFSKEDKAKITDFVVPLMQKTRQQETDLNLKEIEGK